MTFLTRPHLPEQRATLCAIGSGNPDIAQALRGLGIESIEPGPNPLVPEPLQTHADMLLHDAGRGELFAAAGIGAKQLFEPLGFRVTEVPVAGKYPSHAALNGFCLNNLLFGRINSLSQDLLNYYQASGAGLADIKQGYAKCSAAIVDGHSIITADEGIAKAAEASGVDVLRIRPGFIELPGYDTGFIGGTCGLLDKDLLAFCGDLSEHPDGKAIQEYCSKRGVKTHCLVSGPLRDIGGILPLATAQELHFSGG